MTADAEPIHASPALAGKGAGLFPGGSEYGERLGETDQSADVGQGPDRLNGVGKAVGLLRTQQAPDQADELGP